MSGRIVKSALGGAIGAVWEGYVFGKFDGVVGSWRPVYALAALFGFSGEHSFLKNLALVIGVEYLAGLLFNQEKTLWDYSGLPLSFSKHIYLPYSVAFAAVLTLYMNASDDSLDTIFLVVSILWILLLLMRGWDDIRS